MGGHTGTQSNEICTSLQEALEVWDYSSHHLSLFAASPEFHSRPIRFRHMPFSWFPVVRSHLSACKSSSLHVLLEGWYYCHVEPAPQDSDPLGFYSHSDCNVALRSDMYKHCAKEMTTCDLYLSDRHMVSSLCLCQCACIVMSQASRAATLLSANLGSSCKVWQMMLLYAVSS